MSGAQEDFQDGARKSAEIRDLDVAVIGAGLSGICAAAHLAASRPDDDFLVFEARAAIGGTWDLFRYPGVRSDSDMYTLGYSFRPWPGDAALADGPSILDYIRRTAKELDLEKRIAFRHRLVAADWSSDQARWTLTVETPGGRRRFKARFVLFCSGYYDTESGSTPALPGVADFRGDIAHPQAWPEDLPLEGRRVALIGSGATAVTLLPALAARGAHVVQIQRTPSYVMSLPATDHLAAFLRRYLPGRLAYALTRWKNILQGMVFYQLARRRPDWVRRQVKTAAARELGDRADVETDFNPPYDPWDQRFCVAPDGDFFQAIRRGEAEIVTGQIERFTELGVLMKDGREIEADLAVTATGLKLKLAGGAALSVDGRPFSIAESTAYRGAMFSGAPNLFAVFGYVNASWTLKSELIIAWALRLMAHMDRIGAQAATPVPPEDMARRRLVGLSSGYIRRGRHLLPQQGAKPPWRAHQNYLRDLVGFRFGRIGRGLVFSSPAGRPGRTGAEPGRAEAERAQEPAQEA